MSAEDGASAAAERTAPAGSDLDRRRLLQLAGAAGSAGLTSGLGVATGTAGAFTPRRPLHPVTMAMHIHASFSEGIASMDAHLSEAERLGVDVVWWTEHDFRMAAHGYRREVRFDGAHEPDGRWDFRWDPHTTGRLARAEHSFVSTPANPDESGDKLQMLAEARAGASWTSYYVQAVAQNALYSTSYCDTVLELDLHPQSLGGNAHAFVEIVSSYRPATAGRPAGQYRLQYRIGDTRGRRTEQRGLVGVVGIPAPPDGQWDRIRIDPRADHAALWPDTVADDATLWRLNLGLRVRDGATGRAVFDRLRILRARNDGADPRALQRRAVNAYRTRYRGVRQLTAAEISLVMHLNAYGGDGVLPTYDRDNASLDTSVAAQRRMIAFLREHGQTVCINHPLSNSGGPADLVRRLVGGDGLGAHVMEVGVGPKGVRPMTRVFDTLARNGVLITANGSTDDHRGTDWKGPGRRWLTGVWAASRREADLCHALRAGRAWFFDPGRWKGELNLNVEGSRMGSVVFTRKRRVDVLVRATDLPRGTVVRLVTGRCDFAGADVAGPVNRARTIVRKQFRDGRWRGSVERGKGVYIRAEVRRGNQLIGFSNPIWVLPPHRRNDLAVPAARR